MKEYIMKVNDNGIVSAVVCEVVRCKDCAYFIDGGCGNVNSDSPAENLLDVRPDWFCADGERKE